MNFLNQSFFYFFLLFDWVKSYGRVKGAIANLWFLRREEGGILFLLWAQWDLKVPYFLSFCNSDVVNVGQQPPLCTVHSALCTLHCTALHGIPLKYTVLHCTALYCRLLNCPAYTVTLHCTEPYWWLGTSQLSLHLFRSQWLQGTK